MYKNIIYFVLFKDNFNSSEFVISNVFWMSEELMGGRKYNGCNISYKNGVSAIDKPNHLGRFHDIV